MSGAAGRPRAEIEFGTPAYTRVVSEVHGVGEALPELGALPAMIEPELPPVNEPADEPLVPLAHRRVRALSCYWHAGWSQAAPGCWIRRSVMVRLGAVADALPPRWGLAVFDAWRSLQLQAELYDAAYGHPGLPPGFVSPPDPEPTTPPPHLTGGAVDLTLTFDGIPLGPGGGFDDFTDRARAAALEDEPGPDRAVRRLLYRAMRAEGFVVLDCEWWHYEWGTPRWAGLTGRPPRFGPAHP